MLVFLTFALEHVLICSGINLCNTNNNNNDYNSKKFATTKSQLLALHESSGVCTLTVHVHVQLCQSQFQPPAQVNYPGFPAALDVPPMRFNCGWSLEMLLPVLRRPSGLTQPITCEPPACELAAEASHDCLNVTRQNVQVTPPPLMATPRCSTTSLSSNSPVDWERRTRCPITGLIVSYHYVYLKKGFCL